MPVSLVLTRIRRMQAKAWLKNISYYYKFHNVILFLYIMYSVLSRQMSHVSVAAAAEVYQHLAGGQFNRKREPALRRKKNEYRI